MLDHSVPEVALAYRGFDKRTRMHKYEWLEYFDSKREKDAFVEAKRELFRRARRRAVAVADSTRQANWEFSYLPYAYVPHVHYVPTVAVPYHHPPAPAAYRRLRDVVAAPICY